MTGMSETGFIRFQVVTSLQFFFFSFNHLQYLTGVVYTVCAKSAVFCGVGGQHRQ